MTNNYDVERWCVEVNRNLDIMRLSPFLVAVMAFATTAGVSVSANAQTAQTNTESENIFKAASNDSEDASASVSRKSSDAAKLQVVIPTSRNLKTAQNSPQIPPPNNLPEVEQPAPELTPADIPSTQPQIPPVQQRTNSPELQQQQQQQQFQTPGTQQQQQQQQQFQTPGTTQQQQTGDETRVLVSEVLVRSASGQLTRELQDQVYRVIRTQPGRTTTRSQLQEDINAIFGTGFFSNVQVAPEDTPLGVRVSFVVQPNPVLQKVQIDANPGANVPSVLPEKAVNDIFSTQYGQILNLRELQEGIKQ